MNILEQLRDDEKEALLEILNNVKNYKETSKKPRQVRKIIPIEQWVEDPFYIGDSGMAVYPYWKNQLIEIYNSKRDITEVIIDGSLGIGKTTAANFCLMRKLYEISCYENIPGLFELMPGTIITFIYFSVSKTQAELTGYGQLKNLIDQSPYFQKYFKRNDRIQSMMVFPENVMVIFGSESGHSIGMSVIGSVLDEANFRQANAQQENASSDHTKVATMYASILNRATSRFLSGGKNYSLSILVSSNTTASSFTEQRKKQVRNDKHAYLINARLWDVKPKGTYDSKGFWVFVGSNTLDPMIINTTEEFWQVSDSWNLDRPSGEVEACINSLPDGYKDYFTWVPNDFRKQYEDNIIMSLQDISGYSVAPSGRLFSSRPAYNEACNSNLEHPFTKNVIVLSTRDTVSIKDWIRKDWYPMNRSQPRFLHFDQSLAHDRTGVASVYLSHWEKDPNTGVHKPHYSVEMLMSVAPPKPPAKISIEKCIDIVYYLRDVLNLTIGKVSMDSYASAGALQSLEANGISCGLQSVDRTEEQYMYLVNCLLNGQIKMYHHPVLEKELFDLIYYRDKHKVDHPKAYYGSGDASNTTWGGSKDLTDGLCGALWSCYQSLADEQATQFRTEIDRQVNKMDDYSLLDEMGFGDDIFNRVMSVTDMDNLIV